MSSLNMSSSRPIQCRFGRTYSEASNSSVTNSRRALQNDLQRPSVRRNDRREGGCPRPDRNSLVGIWRAGDRFWPMIGIVGGLHQRTLDSQVFPQVPPPPCPKKAEPKLLAGAQ